MPVGQSKWRRPVAEFVAIFAGVSLSLIADDWRDRRADTRAELAGLQLISADLLRDSSEIEYALRPAARYQEPAMWMTAHWDDPDVDMEGLADRLFPLADINQYRPLNAAYSSLRESGGLDLIRNDALRNAIVEYFDYMQTQVVWYVDGANEAQSEFFQRVRRYARLPEPRDPDRGWPLEGPWRLRATWPELREDTELANLIQWLGAWGYFADRRREQAVASNYALRTQIAQELGSR